MRRRQSNLIQVVSRSAIALIMAFVALAPVSSVLAIGSFPEPISISATGEFGDKDTNAKPQISDDGRYVAFMSNSNNLGGQLSNTMAIYVRDRVTQTNTLVTVDSSEQQLSGLGEEYSFSGDGQHVIFAANGTIYVRNTVLGTTKTVGSGGVGLGISYNGSIAASSSSVFPGSVQVHDIPNNTTQLLPESGRFPMVSGDGNRIVFENASLQVVMYDRSSGTTSVVSEGLPSGTAIETEGVSYDGRYVAFRKVDSNSGNWNVYRRDMNNGGPTKIDTSNIAASDTSAMDAAISADGTTVAFNYYGYNLGYDSQIATHNFVSGVTRIASKNAAGELGNGAMYPNESVSLSGSGTLVAFATNSGNFGLPIASQGEFGPNYYYQTFVTNTADDTTPPALGTPTWTANPVTVGNNTRFSVPATDTTSGVVAGEYFIGTDPGAGNATALTWDGTDLSSTDFGANLQPGVYNIGIRAKDTANNWSSTATSYLVVYSPAGPSYIVGQQSLEPTTADILPWLADKTKATFGFNVAFTVNGTVDPTSEFSFNYIEKGSCGKNSAPACRTFVLNATSFDWFATSGTNSSKGDFQGIATLDVSGTTSSVIYRVESVDGDLLTPTAPDSFVLKLYPQSSDPQTATPLYQVSADFTPGSGNANGGVRIK
jgi:hypothetical protein